MRKVLVQCMCFGVGIGLLGASPAWADPLTVTWGHVTAQQTGGTFVLTGDGFALSGAPTVPGYVSGIWECTPCRAGDRLNLSLSSVASGSFDSLPGEFAHVRYQETYLAGILKFTAGDMTSAILGGQRSMTMPFTFFAELMNFESYASRATPGSSPVFLATFTGSGFATAYFKGPFEDPDGPLFFADRIIYEFTSVAPTPEPSSLVLLCTGAAALLARRRARRIREGDTN